MKTFWGILLGIIVVGTFNASVTKFVMRRINPASWPKSALDDYV